VDVEPVLAGACAGDDPRDCALIGGGLLEGDGPVASLPGLLFASVARLPLGANIAGRNNRVGRHFLGKVKPNSDSASEESGA